MRSNLTTPTQNFYYILCSDCHVESIRLFRLLSQKKARPPKAKPLFKKTNLYSSLQKLVACAH